MKNNPMKQISVTITNQEFTILKALSDCNGLTISDLIRRALDIVYPNKKSGE